MLTITAGGSLATTITTAGSGCELARSDGQDLIWRWLASLDLSEKSIQIHTVNIRRWREWCEERGVDPCGASRAEVVEYRRHLSEDQGLRPATVNTYLAAVKSLYRWLEGEGISPDVARGVRGLKTGKAHSKDALSKEQAARLCEVHGEGEMELRDAAMVNLMTRRGLRTVEVANANIGDIGTVNGNSVLWILGKGHDEKDEFVALGADCLNMISDYLAARGCDDPEAPLFASVARRNKGSRLTTISISRIVKERMRSLGMDSERLSAHSLRHTAVTFALLGGASVQEVQGMARHSDISTTLIYAHNLDRSEAAAERAVDSFMDGGE